MLQDASVCASCLSHQAQIAMDLQGPKCSHGTEQLQ
jgi:hypothetical protein